MSKGVWLWPLASALMLAGMLAEARTHVEPADANQHLADCKKAILDIPTTILGPTGNIWSGTDVPQPAAATQLLRPNVILSRQYVRHGSEDQVSLLIVHCKDARDLQGHYPHNCYPAQGQKELSQEPRTWHLRDMDIRGIEYHFAGEGLGEQRVVYNFFVTPAIPGKLVSHPELNGAICPDIDSVYTSGEDYQRRYYGAAEFQLVSSAPMTAEQRDQAFVDLLTPNENVIRTLENRNDVRANRGQNAASPDEGVLSLNPGGK